MDERGIIEIRVRGQIGGEPLKPDNFDIREIRSLFDIVENLLYPSQKSVRPPITYSMESGSVRNIFRTSLQAATSFLAVMALVEGQKSLEGLELATAQALQEVQKSAVRNNYEYYFGKPGQEPSLVISPATTYHVSEYAWAEAEFYFYGQLVNAGGKDKTNIHLLTKSNGLITIATNREFLEGLEENVLYRHFSVRAKGRQNITTGEIDTTSLVLLELQLHDPKYNEQYLSNLIRQAAPRWSDVRDVDSWVSELRANG